MRKSLTYKILAAVMAAGSLGLYAATPAAAEKIFNAPEDGTIVNENFDNVYGNGTPITITGGTIGYVYGAGNGNKDYDKDASGGNVTISGDNSRVTIVYGGDSERGEVYNNTVNISGGSVSFVYGGDSDYSNTYNNTVNISGNAKTGYVYGGDSERGEVYNNTVNISDGTIGSDQWSAYVYGGRSAYGTAHHNTVNIRGGTIGSDQWSAYVYGGRSAYGTAHHNTVNIRGNAKTGFVYGGYSDYSNTYNNTVNISGNAKTDYVHGGRSAYGTAHHNTVNISGGTIGADGSIDVYGGYSEFSNTYNNTVNISGGSVTGNIYGGYISSNVNNNTIDNNEVVISGSADIKNANLYGRSYNASGTGNTLTIDGWNGSTKSVKNFNDIAFKNINWQNGNNVLTITTGSAADLTNTTIDTINIAGGSNINVGESMTLINGNISSIGDVTDTFTAGVAREGLGSTNVNGNVVTFNIDSIKLSSQAVSAAQTRAASAAFVNQGTDLISDSLDTISRDDNYGVKTFAAVHGNRSKYDVADDIKINGWSTIVGVGNADKFDNGSEFSWGVFYENGSGNYRTYNSFNNEFFRGDGSMVYNGGGIAARYENKNGVYTEGSLRAGMLKNELDNAMRDVNGSYGYETESAYYGAHIGVGKIISLSDSSDLDIYGKFFHTYTEGDSVTIAGDKFDFDSITSDRLRVGARITSNKENKFSTYYGLAYEYEFNGDADMTAQGLRADTQSLQGSSVMAEVGFNYQPTPTSPWSFDLNMRGYTGERQGGSFNVQATYTF